MKKKEQNKKRFPVLTVIFCVLILGALGVYAGGVFYYQNHFVNGTVIDKADVSGMTLEELSGQVQDYMLQITERKSDGSTLDEDIQGISIGLGYSSMEPLETIMREQNVWLWFLKPGTAHELEKVISYDESMLEQAVDGLKGFDSSFASAPTDAYISDYVEGSGFSGPGRGRGTARQQ